MKKTAFFFQSHSSAPKEAVAVPVEESQETRASTCQLVNDAFLRPTDNDTGSSKQSV